MNILTRWIRPKAASNVPDVAKLIAKKQLRMVFQPMVSLLDGSISHYEALARVPHEPSFEHAEALFEAAKAQHHHRQLELACMEIAIEQWARKTNGAQLSLNISAASLVHLERGTEDGALLRLIDRCHLPARVLTIEITRVHKSIAPEDLVLAANKLRRHKVQITFDDFRCTESHMRLWSRMTPEVVKMDTKLTLGIANDLDKQRRVKSLVAMSRRYGSRLAAKGVESAQDIVVLNSMGVDFGQGYFLGSPDAQPVEALNLRARQVLQSSWGISAATSPPMIVGTVRH